MGALSLSFAAGVLSVLSPCVLPLLPVVIASAMHSHRHGPLALAAGLVVSSTAIGLVFASLGFTWGVDRDMARAVAAALMVAAGLVLLLPRLQDAFATMSAPLARGADRVVRRLPPGFGGQLLLGSLLGAVWTPCAGPTLAAALSLAARSESLLRAVVVMLVFGVGAAVPVIALAYGARRALFGRRAWLGSAVSTAQPIMGGVLLLVGVLTVTGADKVVETWMVDHMPSWFVDLTTWL